MQTDTARFFGGADVHLCLGSTVLVVWQGCFGKWLAPFSLFYAEKNTKRGEKYRKGRKKDKKGRKRAGKRRESARKMQENATETPILGFGSGRLRGARGVSAVSKEKRGFKAPRCGESGNKKRGLARDSEGISGIGGFGAFAIVKGGVRWTRRLGRGATEPE